VSIKVMDRVWEHSKANGTPLLVLLCLADWANDDGECWPSISTIGKKCRLKDNRHVKRVIRELERINEVVVVVEGGKSSRKGGVRSNLYMITVHIPAESMTVADRPPSDYDDGGSQTPQTVVEGPPMTVAEGPPEPSVETSMNPLAPAGADAEERVALRAAVIQACQLDPDRITSSAEAALSKATKDISDVGGTSEDVAEAANAYRTRFPQASMTPLALAKHWPALSGSSSQGQPKRTIPWYERIAIVTARSISDPVEARAQITDELGAEVDFIELAMMAWEQTRNDAGAAHCGAF
jgi:Helix-turn-helix domain